MRFRRGREPLALCHRMRQWREVLANQPQRIARLSANDKFFAFTGRSARYFRLDEFYSRANRVAVIVNRYRDDRAGDAPEREVDVGHQVVADVPIPPQWWHDLAVPPTLQIRKVGHLQSHRPPHVGSSVPVSVRVSTRRARYSRCSFLSQAIAAGQRGLP